MEALSPDVIHAALTDYSDPKQIVTPMDKSAGLYKIDAYGDQPSMPQIKQAIYQYGAVIGLLDIGDGWWGERPHRGRHLSAHTRQSGLPALRSSLR